MKKIVGIVVFTAVLAAFLAWRTPDAFLSAYNLKNVSRLVAFLSILAIGEAVVIISGGIDLSVGAIVGYSALVLVYLIGTNGVHPALAVPVVFALALLVGSIQGQLVTRLNLQPFIVTLGGMMVLRGLAQVLTRGGAAGLGPGHETFEKLGTGFLFGVIPAPVVILVFVAAGCHFLMRHTVAGRYLYAIGHNEAGALYSGINVGRYKRLAYLLCAALAGVTGILYAPYLASVQPSFGTAFELYAIAAAVLGGCSLRGGEGAVLGVIVGATLMRLIGNGINLLGISTYWEFTVIGMVILMAAVLDVLLTKNAEGRAAA